MSPVVRFLILPFLFVSLSVAQSPNGTISGIVHDPSDRPIPDAEILIANDLTNIQYQTRTSDEGIYVVTNLPPGSYRIQVTKRGFKTLIKPGLTLNVQDALSVSITLPLGAVAEVVTVEGGASLVNTQSAAVSTIIDRTFVENLPLNGRSFNTLLQLTPGVVIAPLAGFGQAPGQFSIAGQRTDGNNFSVDGVSANFGVNGGTNDPGQSGTGTSQALSALGGTSSLVSVDALQEFRIETSSFSPEFGRAPGGQVILTTRSGTNDIHGSAFDYFRNTVMDANDWFSNAGGLGRSPEHHNDFGGVLGGPIRKDKNFFFVSYEGARLRLPETIVTQVPSIAIRTASSTPAQLVPFLIAYPVPNGATSPSGDTAQFTGGSSVAGTLNAGSVRIDHYFSSKLSIFGRYNDAPSELVGRPAQSTDLQTSIVNTQTLTVGVNMLLNQRFINSLRGNYSKQNAKSSNSLDSFGGAVPLDPSVFFNGLPSNQTWGSFFPLDAAPIQTGPLVNNKAQQFNIADDLSIASGKHRAKVGGDYRAIFLNSANAQHTVGLTAFTVAGFVSTGTVDFLEVSSQAKAQLLSQALSLYAQDTWKPTSRLTVTYGLRWELSPAPAARGGTVLAAWENVNNPSQTSLAPRGTPLWATRYGNIAPRLGVAYLLTGRGDLVLRVGGGIFYDLGVGTAASAIASFPNNASAFFSSVPVPVSNLPSFLPTLSLQAPYPDGGVSAFDPNLKLPRSYQWSVALEKSFGEKQTVSLTYVGQAGRDLLRQEVLFQPNPNFLGGFNLTQNDSRSNYNALQVQYRRPLRSRLQALLNYSWSHSLDNASNDVVAGVSNTVISAAHDYASSDFDVRQSFSAALAYDIPGAGSVKALKLLTNDWSIDTVIVARTGFPFNALIVAPSSVLGVANTRPDLVPGQPLWIATSTAPGGKMLNVSAFSVPTTTTQGTEGRNDIPGFGLTQVDLSLGRKFPITSRVSLQFRTDAFNVLNHPNFSNPPGNIQFGSFFLQSPSMLNRGLGGLNPLFQQGGPRSLQLSLRLAF